MAGVASTSNVDQGVVGAPGAVHAAPGSFYVSQVAGRPNGGRNANFTAPYNTDADLSAAFRPSHRAPMATSRPQGSPPQQSPAGGWAPPQRTPLPPLQAVAAATAARGGGDISPSGDAILTDSGTEMAQMMKMMAAMVERQRATDETIARLLAESSRSSSCSALSASSGVGAWRSSECGGRVRGDSTDREIKVGEAPRPPARTSPQQHYVAADHPENKAPPTPPRSTRVAPSSGDVLPELHRLRRCWGLHRLRRRRRGFGVGR
jgi:hypothetical protein